MNRFYQEIFLVLLILGLGISGILSYNYFSPEPIFCSSEGLFDCQSISGYASPYSKFIMPWAFWGIGFYTLTLIYFFLSFSSSKFSLSKTLSKKETSQPNPNSEDVLQLPFFLLLVLSNLVNVFLLGLSLYLYTKQGKLCIWCFAFYTVTFLLLIWFYRNHFKEKSSLKKAWNSFIQSKEEKKEERKKGFSLFVLVGLCIFTLLFLFSRYKNLDLEFQYYIKSVDLYEQEIQKKIQSYESRIVVPIPLDSAPFTGEKDAPIHLVVYHDLQCGSCILSHPHVEKLAEEYAPLLRISYLNFPHLDRSLGDWNSLELSLYSLVAHEKGQYSPFIETLYSHFEKGEYVGKEKLLEIFKKIGISSSYEEISKQAEKHLQEVNSQIQNLRTIFKTNDYSEIGTPAFVLNGKLVGTGLNLRVLKKLIENQMIQFAKGSINSSTNKN